jgi:hypothetical protein
MSNLLDLPASTMAGPLDTVPKSEWPALGEFLAKFLIHGVTAQGKPFRPSDWSERLCGVMACFRPGASALGRDALIGYSPFVRPVSIGDVKCVLVDPALREIEPMALDFVVNFARDNGLRVTAAQAAVAA